MTISTEQPKNLNQQVSLNFKVTIGKTLSTLSYKP